VHVAAASRRFTVAQALKDAAAAVKARRALIRIRKA
jgi:hypothetical protein